MSTPLKVLSSMAPREVLTELATCCTRDLLQPLVTEAAGGVDAAKRVQAGEVVDIVVLASNVIDRLISEGRLRTGSRVDLMKSGVGVAVRKDSKRYDINSERCSQSRRACCPKSELFNRPKRHLLDATVRTLGNSRNDKREDRCSTPGNTCGNTGGPGRM